jgi:negative regulator of sigma E activity
MLDEQLEFAISQYADGTLPASRRQAIEAQIAADPALDALLEEYRQIGSALQSAPALPAINWDRLASHLSDAVAQSDVQSDIQDQPIPLYANPWVRRIASLAVAACLAVAIGVGYERGKTSSTAVPSGPTQLAVTGPVADAPAGAVVQQITIGPSPAVAMEDATWRYSDSGVVAHPQRVVIASSDAPVQDTPATPY